MTEDEAREWVCDRFGAGKLELLDRFVTVLLEESRRQNLISAASVAHVWVRHIVDSAQLLPLIEDHGGLWLDIGTGAGMPGLVAALLRDGPVRLVEPRAKRAQYLADTATALGCKNVTVSQARVESFVPSQAFSYISARAVAALPELLASAAHCADFSTTWLLPKGRSAQSAVEAARRTWHGVFHVERSVTDAEAGIVIAKGVRRR